MPPNKTKFDLTDRGWVDLYVKRCESIMKEFTDYVYALQNQCLKERSRIVELDRNCKQLKTKLVEEKSKQQFQDEKGSTIYAPLDPSPINNGILGVTRTPSKADGDRTTMSDCSPAFLNMAMDSEQLNMESSCILSPAQHHQNIFSSSEQLTSPNRSSIAIDSALLHNTSPTCKVKSSNENKSALGFLKARGRVGKTLYNDSYEHKLREQNSSNENDRTLKHKEKLQAKRSDWIGKDKKGEERRAGLKRSASNIDEVLRKRSMMSLNKSGERKLRQSRLTQMVSMKSSKAENDIISTSPEDVCDAQKFAISPTTTSTASTAIPGRLAFPMYPSDTDDIFRFSSDDDDEHKMKKSTDNSAIEQNVKKCSDTTLFQPLPNETEKSDSVLAITPTAPPLICIDDSDDNEHGSDNTVNFGKMTTKQVTQKHAKRTSVIVKKEKSATENLATELAAAMLAEWEEEPDHEDKKSKPLKKTVKHEIRSVDLKPRLSQLPEPKISIKERFNVDCDECQKYIDFMGSNMSLSDIEAHLRRCTLHRTAKDGIPTTPPNYWNPLMPSFSENDPRNRTLLEDPYIQRKRGSNK